MRKFFHSIIPDEWVAAWTGYSEMAAISFATPRAVVKNCVNVFLPFVAGALVSLLIKSHLTSDFVQAYLVVLGVLFGFVTTIMVFIGSTEGTDILGYDEATTYAKSIRYLLASQALTLICYLAAIVFGSWWLFSKDSGPTATAYIYLEPIVFGSGAISFIRTILLPAQIYDRHDFVMRELVIQKKIKHQNKIEKMQNRLRKPT